MVAGSTMGSSGRNSSREEVSVELRGGNESTCSGAGPAEELGQLVAAACSGGPASKGETRPVASTTANSVAITTANGPVEVTLAGSGFGATVEMGGETTELEAGILELPLLQLASRAR